MERAHKYLQQQDYARALIELQNAAHAVPLDAEPLYEIGLVHMKVGNSRLALEAMRRATELNPKHWQARTKVAELLASGTEPSVLNEALSHAQAVVSTMPGEPDALNALGVAEWKLGRKDQAEQHLREAFERAPQNWNTAISVAKIRLSQNDPKGAEDVLKQAAESQPQSANSVLALAEFYISRGRLDEGEQSLRRALIIDTNNVSALFDLAALEVKSGRLEQADVTFKRISTLPHPRYRPLHAMFLVQSGKAAEGVAELERLFKADPGGREVRTALISAYLITGNRLKAEQVLSEALQANPRDIDALFQRAGLRLEAARYKDAAADILQVLRVRPDQAEAHYMLAKIHRRSGERLSQKPELEEALRLNPQFLAARIDLAGYLIEVKAPQAALQLLDAAPDSQKNSLEVITKRNWALLSLGDREALRRGIEKGLAVRRTPELLTQNAMSQLDRRAFTEAQASIREALRYDPDNLRALNLLAHSYVVQGRGAEALEAIGQYARSRPESAVVQQLLGEMLLAQGKRQEARSAFLAAKAANRTPGNADVFLAELDLGEGKPDAARAAVAGVIAADPGNTRARFLLATLEEARGKYDLAAGHYRKILEEDPDNVPALNNLANVLADGLNNPAEALEYAQKAKEYAPYNADIEDTLGWVFYKKGLYTAAVRHLEMAVSRQATARHRCHLAMAYWQAGDHKRGRETLEAALRQDPKVAEGRQARQLLGVPD